MKTKLATFLWQFARHPLRTGAIAPSSHFLAHRMVDDLQLETAEVVFEFGAGTGSFTVEILERMKPGATFVAVEINRHMARHLRKRFPELRIMEDSAENVAEFRRLHGIGPIDCIVCGLPWTFFKREIQNRLLNSVVENLAPDGRFATFAYVHARWTPPGRRLRNELVRCFDSVQATRTVWRNMPPAIVYQCRAKKNGAEVTVQVADW